MAEGARPEAIDLETLAAGYDHRAVGPGDRERAATAAKAARLGSGDVAIDVGGGRGGHAAVFSEVGAVAVVADRSPAMAEHSAQAGVHAVVADGECLPFRDEIAALVYFHLAIHHGDAVRMLREAARVSRPGGLVWVWTLDPTHHGASFLARWFPSVGPIDERRFPHPDVLGGAMTECGLTPGPSLMVSEQIVRTAGSWESAVRSGFVSTLQLISPDEIEEGLARFLVAHPDPNAEISYSLTYRCVAGFRPSLVS